MIQTLVLTPFADGTSTEAGEIPVANDGLD